MAFVFLSQEAVYPKWAWEKWGDCGCKIMFVRPNLVVLFLFKLIQWFGSFPLFCMNEPFHSTISSELRMVIYTPGFQVGATEAMRGHCLKWINWNHYQSIFVSCVGFFLLLEHVTTQKCAKCPVNSNNCVPLADMNQKGTIISIHRGSALSWTYTMLKSFPIFEPRERFLHLLKTAPLLA